MNGPTTGQPPEPRARLEPFEPFLEQERSDVAAIGRIFVAVDDDDEVHAIVSRLVIVELFRTTSVIREVIDSIELGGSGDVSVKHCDRRLELVSVLGHLKGLLRDIIELGHATAKALEAQS